MGLLNVVILEGRIAHDLKLIKVPNSPVHWNKNTVCCNFWLFIPQFSPAMKPGDDPIILPKDKRVPVAVWGRQAQNLVKYKRKGDLISVRGRIDMRNLPFTCGNYHDQMFVRALEINYLNTNIPRGYFDENIDSPEEDVDYVDYKLKRIERMKEKEKNE